MDLLPSSSTHSKIHITKNYIKEEDVHFDDSQLDNNFGAKNLENVDCVKSLEHLKTEKQNLIEKQKLLQQENHDLDLEIKELRNKLTNTKKQITPNQELEILQKCFSPAQIKLLQGQNKSRWSLDDLAMGFTIKSFCSRDFYIYLRKDLKFPLPAESNMNRSYRSKYNTKNDNSSEKN